MHAATKTTQQQTLTVLLHCTISMKEGTTLPQIQQPCSRAKEATKLFYFQRHIYELRTNAVKVCRRGISLPSHVHRDIKIKHSAHKHELAVNWKSVCRQTISSTAFS
jgi:hypothetical protein